jgi:hypothetical protein
MEMKVYQAICAITEAMSHTGIAKDRKNTMQGYQFRGIDDVYAAISPLLAQHRLCILPRVVDRSVTEHQTAKGGTLFYTVVKVEYDFVHAEDGSKHTVTMIGEAMDSGDKSSNKAQSAAYKYACFQAFCIPTEGDNDADATTHEVKTAAPRHKPTGTPLVAHDRFLVLGDTILGVQERMRKDDVVGAFELYQSITDAEERTFIWDKLSAPIRRAIKDHGTSIKEAA